MTAPKRETPKRHRHNPQEEVNAAFDNLVSDDGCRVSEITISAGAGPFARRFAEEFRKAMERKPAAATSTKGKEKKR